MSLSVYPLSLAMPETRNNFIHFELYFCDYFTNGCVDCVKS